jgi:hypothetical protein
MEAFVYCWADHKTNNLYIGSHKGDPDDGYVCSYKYMMEEYNNRPSDFIRQIIATGTQENIRVFESIKECSEVLGIAYDNVWYKIRAKHKDWSYT